MTLELADRSITEQIGIAKDVRLMVGKFQFPSDFVVVDFEPDLRVPLILGRSFLKTSHALIDVYEGEITLHVGKEAITFNLDQTSRYTANYDHMTANRIDVIELACEEYSQEVLNFSDSIAYGHPSPDYDPIVSNSSPTLTPFGDIMGKARYTDVPKKGGITVVKNDDNDLIPTRLVTGWRVCIDYRKLNEATRKDHFPLPFMDQMLERLAWK
ncbi:reverse transcriptase domain-containing protein [Tanacetum coccineum]